MDLTTIGTKIEMGQYSSVSEFKSDFILMCNNAMTYNAPETVYYGSAKRLLTTGLQVIARVCTCTLSIALKLSDNVVKYLLEIFIEGC